MCPLHVSLSKRQLFSLTCTTTIIMFIHSTDYVTATTSTIFLHSKFFASCTILSLTVCVYIYGSKPSTGMSFAVLFPNHSNKYSALFHKNLVFLCRIIGPTENHWTYTVHTHHSSSLLTSLILSLPLPFTVPSKFTSSCSSDLWMVIQLSVNQESVHFVESLVMMVFMALNRLTILPGLLLSYLHLFLFPYMLLIFSW